MEDHYRELTQDDVASLRRTFPGARIDISFPWQVYGSVRLPNGSHLLAYVSSSGRYCGLRAHDCAVTAVDFYEARRRLVEAATSRLKYLEAETKDLSRLLEQCND